MNLVAFCIYIYIFGGHRSKVGGCKMWSVQLESSFYANKDVIYFLLLIDIII